jgi:hypothetical protein
MRLAKDIGPPWYLFDTKQFDKCFYSNNQVYIGHNRFKTTGEVTRKNAHPFMFEDVLGAHNGTIDYQNKNRLECGSNFKTDSEAIFNNIQVHGIEDTISKIEKTEPYALTWYDKRDNTLNFLRNEHRPLFYIYTDNRKQMFWASEVEILMAAVGRNGIKTPEKPFACTPDTWYKWAMPSLSIQELPEPERKKLTNYEPQYTVHSMWKNNKWVDKDSDKGYGSFADYEGWNELTQSFDDGVGYGTGAGTVSDICQLPQDKKNDFLDRVIEGVKKLTGPNPVIEGVVTEVKETKVLTPVDFMRLQKLDKIKPTGLTDKGLAKLPMIYENVDKTIIVYQDRDTGEFLMHKWAPGRIEWDVFKTKKPPEEMPFRIVDIQARHTFEHTGKGKHKKIFYKGFKGSRLTQDQFNKVITDGCYHCDRTPEWGNDVVFLDHDHAFLCEYCAAIPYLAEDLRRERKAAG